MVLVVDDNEYLAQSIKELLIRHKIVSIIASNGEEAIKECAKAEFRVVVTDVHMPKMTGLEFIKQLHQKSYPAEVVVYSGHITKSEMQDVLKFPNVFAIHRKSDLIEKLILSIQKAEIFNDTRRNIEGSSV